MQIGTRQSAEAENQDVAAALPAMTIFGLCDDCDLVAEANHRIANHLALLAGSVRLRIGDISSCTTEPTRDSVRFMLQGFGGQLGAISRLHRTLARNARLESVDFCEHLHDVCAPYLFDQSSTITFIEDFAPGCVVRPAQLMPLVQILTEVITNAVKYSHAPGETGTILVRCRQDDAGMLSVEIVDDGCGFQPGFDPLTHGGLGFHVLRALAKRLGALIEFKSAPTGVRFRLALAPA